MKEKSFKGGVTRRMDTEPGEEWFELLLDQPTEVWKAVSPQAERQPRVRDSLQRSGFDTVRISK